MKTYLDINDVKEIIIEGIEEERVKMNERYNRNKEDVYKIDNVPEAIKEFVEIYGNSAEQRKKMTDILKGYLQADFFREAGIGRGSSSIVSGANNVFFNSGDYFIGFSTSRIYNVIVGRTETLRPPSKKFLPIGKDILEFDVLWNTYQETGEGHDELIDAYSILKKAETAGFIYKMKLKMSKEVEEFAMNQKELIEDFDSKKKAWESELEEYNEKKELFYVLMDNVKGDLMKFIERGWHIQYSNLDNLIAEDRPEVI